MYNESSIRSICKAFSWRVLATATTVLIAFFVFGEIDKAMVVGGIEVVGKFMLYFLHERVWNAISLGRELKPFENKSHPSFVLWFTGLPCSGKTTLAKRMEQELRATCLPVERLDGDELRGVLPNKGFSREAREAHIKQVGFWASKLERQGVCVLASFVSPYEESRAFARKQCNNFIEVYLSTSVEECERRDVKGMYAKARTGEICNFTGVDDPYEQPLDFDLIFDTEKQSIESCVEEIKNYLAKMDLLANEEDAGFEQKYEVIDGPSVAA